MFGAFRSGETRSDTKEVAAERWDRSYLKDYNIELPESGKLDIEYDINNFTRFDLIVLDIKNNEIIKNPIIIWRTIKAFMITIMI